MEKEKPQGKGPISKISSSAGTGSIETYEQLYLQYRSDFLQFGKGFGLQKEEILDAFQEAVIIFFEQQRAGKLENLTSSAKTYLFSIGKHKMIDHIRDQVKREKYLAQRGAVEGEKTAIDELILTQRQLQLKEAINELGAKCRELLLLFYYQSFSIGAIRERMGYNTDNVVKANKSRCMKTLRGIAKSKDLK